MSSITTRAAKGSALTHAEVDANFTNLNSGKAEVSGQTFTGSVTLPAGSATAAGVKVGTGTTYAPGLYSPGTDQLAISTGGTGRLFVDASGRVLVGLTSANTSGAKLQTADGLTFPAAQVASADPNTLDDYEEGTFTPVLNGASSIGTGTYTLQQGRYTKIGRTVSIDIVLTWTAHTGVGTMFITGLPFSFSVGFGYRATLSINTTGVSATVAYGDGAYANISIPATIAGSGTIYINGIYQN